MKKQAKKPNVKPSTLLYDCVDKIAPNRIGTCVKLQTPALDDPYYAITTPGGFKPTEAALIEAEAARRGIETKVSVNLARQVYCGHCGVWIESSHVESSEPQEIRVNHACLGSITYALSVLPLSWEAPVFAYDNRLAFVKTSGPEHERGVIVGTPVLIN